MSVMVKAKTGKYEGKILSSGVLQFLGIPYAKPPKRWKRAEELEPSEAVFKAAENGPACWQEVLKEEWEQEPPMSEDCLTLNIWTGDTETKKPVLVWIHGGCYATGSNRTDCFGGVYCGDEFVAVSRDIVYVNINYRINIFGSVDLSKWDPDGEYTNSNNLQTFDQITALKWISENIEAFGGDPQNITISGQSAGGMSVASLMAIPEANQYFHKVICQSTALSDAFLKKREDAAKLSERFYKIAGADSLQDLLQMPADKLRDAGQRLFESIKPGETGAFEMIWGKSGFPENPCEILRKGMVKHIPLMIGTVAGEFDTVGSFLSEEELKDQAKAIFPNAIDDTFVQQFCENEKTRDRRTAYQDLWNDSLLRMGAVNTAEAQAQGGGKVYLYYISFLPEGAKLRPQHCFEIPYVTLKKDNLVYMDQNTGEPVQGSKPSEELEHRLHECWANFVRYGNPNGEHIETLWPAYTQEKQETMVIDRQWQVEKGVRRKDTKMLLPLHQKKG